MIEIKNLHASIDGKKILKGLDLTINKGEIHAIMGPNGSGKSTLSSVLAGREDYEVEAGSVIFNGKDLLDLEPDERAREGLFMAFQYPVEIPGVSNNNFLRAAVNEVRKHNGLEELEAIEFLKLMKQYAKLMEVDDQMRSRSVNVGFSGGEKKRNEILQMLMLQPKLAILDETDSGLDIDALKVVSNGVHHMKNENNAFLIITHYQRLLDHIEPDVIHVLYDGRIVKTGDKTLALELEEKGYDWLKGKAVEAE